MGNTHWAIDEHDGLGIQPLDIGDFRNANAHDDEVIEALETLRPGQEVAFGGGAQPEVTVMRLGEPHYLDAVRLLGMLIDTAPDEVADDYEACVEVLLDAELWIPLDWRDALIASGRRYVEAAQ